jgi:Tfp pilus assembly protein PilN
MRLTRLNFVSSNGSFRGWRLVVLAVGLIVLLTSALSWSYQQKVNDAMTVQVAQLQPRMAVKPTRSASQQRELDQRTKVVTEAVRQLNLPIENLIKALQPPRDIRVALLGLDVRSGSGEQASDVARTLKISAEARTPREMTMYVAFLGDQRLFKSVYLVKHEINAASPEQPYRFQMEAQWQE